MEIWVLFPNLDADRDPDAFSKNEGEEGRQSLSYNPTYNPKRLFSVQPVFFATYKKTQTNISYKYVIFKYCFETFFSILPKKLFNNNCRECSETNILFRAIFCTPHIFRPIAGKCEFT